LQYAQDQDFSQGLVTVSGLTSDAYTPGSALATNTLYYWRVEAIDEAGNHSGFKGAPFQFMIVVAGWSKKDDAAGTAKPVKGGGGITALGDNVYLLAGNNTRTFLKYSISGHSWSALETVPGGPRNKKAKKGAWIWDDGDIVHAFKGGGTNEFYRYAPSLGHWDSLPSPSFTKGVRAGFATVAQLAGTKYAYAGSGSGNNEWQRFNLSTNLWQAAVPATLPVEKAKVGSSLAGDGAGHLYFMTGGGKRNYFYYLDLNAPTPTWAAKDSLPLAVPGTTHRKKVKEGASIEYFNGKVYATKGGNTKELWYYQPACDSWTYAGDVGSGAPAKGIKCGRSLTSSTVAGGLYVLIGNGTNELWYYAGSGIFGRPKVADDAEAGSRIPCPGLGMSVGPNPTHGTALVSFSLPDREGAELRIYNSVGELIYAAVTDNGFLMTPRLPAGIYLLQLETQGYHEERQLVVVR
jgi:hypothetical protein